jgi:tetratricopeptide (TPR) repeat protein
MELGSTNRPESVLVPTPLSVATATEIQLFLTPTSTLPTVIPSSTQAESAPTATPKPLHEAARSAVALTGFNHQWQTWNNCGPATLSMQMSYFGSQLDQAAIGSHLRTNPDDKNVSPDELLRFAQNHGYEAHILVNGSADQLKLLLSNGIPVLIETWLEDEPDDGMGHYRLLTGYDDAAGHWIAYDSYVSHDLLNPDGEYAGIAFPYGEMDALWRVFNRTYLVLYPQPQSALISSILGDQLDAEVMVQHSLDSALAATQANPQDPFGWFNLGSSLVLQERYREAAAAYDQARQLGLPWRMLWYQFGPFEAYFNIGRHQEVIALADATIATTQSVEELYYWKGRSLHALDNNIEAQRMLQKALELNSKYTLAAQAMTVVSGP